MIRECEVVSKVRTAFVVKYDNQRIAYHKITSQFNDEPECFQSNYSEIEDLVYVGLKRPSWINSFTLCRVEQYYVVIKFDDYLSVNDEARFV